MSLEKCLMQARRFKRVAKKRMLKLGMPDYYIRYDELDDTATLVSGQYKDRPELRAKYVFGTSGIVSHESVKAAPWWPQTTLERAIRMEERGDLA